MIFLNDFFLHIFWKMPIDYAEKDEIKELLKF